MSQVPLLRVGTAGPIVTAVQWILNQAGVTERDLNLDGVFGKLTRQAVATFQHRAGVSSDGIVGPQTWNAFAESLEGGRHGPAAGSQTVFPDTLSAAFVKSLSERSGSHHLQFGGGGGGNGSGGGKSSKEPKQLKSMVKPTGFSKLGDNAIIGLIYFETDSHTLDAQDKQELKKLAAYKKYWDSHPSSPPLLFRYDAWCDTTGTFAHNKELAKKRGTEVETYVRSHVLTNHAKYRQPAKINAIGRKWKPTPKSDPAERVVLIIAPPLKRTPKPKPKPPTLIDRIVRAMTAIMQKPPSQVQFGHIICFLSKLLVEEGGGPKSYDEFWDGENRDFSRAMESMRPPLTPTEIKLDALKK